jgi:hypothetical protein
MKIFLFILSLAFATASLATFVASPAIAQQSGAKKSTTAQPNGGGSINKKKNGKGGCSSYSRNRACY